MSETELRWGIGLDDTYGRVLLGFIINFGDDSGYICVYLGFKTLVIGKDYFPKKEEK